VVAVVGPKMKEKRKWLFASLFLIAGIAFIEQQLVPRHQNGASLPAVVRIGQVIQHEAPSEFTLPFAGVVKCGATTEKVSIPCPDDTELKADLRVFYSTTGQPVRIAYSKVGGFRGLPPISDTEMYLSLHGEKILGVGKLPLPCGWDTVFRHLSKHVDLREAKYFDMSYVERMVGKTKMNVFVCRIFGARGLDGPSAIEELNNVRITYEPDGEYLVFDTDL
jgi:hypothetical protein